MVQGCTAWHCGQDSFLHCRGLENVALPLAWCFTWAMVGMGYDQPRQHIKRQRHTLPTKVRLVKAMVLPVAMYGCESWTIKKVERRRIDAFELWCWRGLLRIPWTARSSDQSILKEISPDTEAPILWPPDVKN